MALPSATDVEVIGAGSSGGCTVGASASELAGFHGSACDQAAALTAQLTTITIADAPGTPDYALQAVINTNAYGFASAAEAISFLYVVKNLQTRLAEVEAILEEKGLCAAN